MSPYPAEKSQMDPASTIALVGLSCRLPGAPDPAAFWRLLAEGRDAVTEAPTDRPGAGVGGFLDDVAGFDPALFGITGREAAAMDPQQRLVLELAWEALEDAGLPTDQLRGRTGGVYVGAIADDYATLPGAVGEPPLTEHTFTGRSRAVIANRVSYTFGLHGPSLVVDSGQSSSLVAVDLACRALRAGEIDVALAGGVHLNLAGRGALAAAASGVLSPTGACHTFDRAADGFVRGEGAALVVLKTLDRALADGDDVYCVILGGAVNQNGHGDTLAAPAATAQRALIEQAHRQAGVAASDVQYVELHGTGTRLGDRAEAAALGATFDRGAGGPPLLVGSVKTNLGHTEGAAGVVGLAKVALAIVHRRLPPSRNFVAAPPEIPLDEYGISVAAGLLPWPGPGRRLIAGVSSFGIGGTNCHLVVAEAPRRETATRRAEPFDGTLPWVLSGHTPAALRAQAARLHAFASATDPGSEHAGPRPGDVGFSLAATRTALPHRAAVFGDTAAELLAGLAGLGGPQVLLGTATTRETVFVFPGQGTQWPGMGAALVRDSAVFRDKIDECSAAFAPHLGWSVAEVLCGSAEPAGDDVVQPLLFTMMLGLAQLWRAHGVEPAAVIGHSQGEIAAACFAGALTVEQAATVVARRALLLRGLAGTGGLAWLAASEPDAARYLHGDLSLAAINGPRSVVIGGSEAALGDLLAACGRDGVRAARIPIDYASHTAHVEEVRAEMLAALAGVTMRATRIPFVSTVTGGPLDTDGLGGGYWYDNLRRPVLFRDAVGRLGAGHRAFVEISAHPVLRDSIEETLAGDPDAAVLATLRRGSGGLDRFRRSAAEAYLRGVPVDWAGQHRGARRLRLPGYAFQRRRYWLDETVDAQAPAAPAAPAVPAGTDLLALVREHTAAVLGNGSGDTVEPTGTFTDLGLDSRATIALVDRLRAATGLPLTGALPYSHPTPAAVARRLSALGAGPAGGGDPAEPPAAPAPAGSDDPVVVVGLGCRLPSGITAPEQLWRAVLDGTDAITPFPDDRGWDTDRLYHPVPGTPGRTYVREGGFLDAGSFDPAFFGISPREAATIDPQQRLILQTSWEAFERAGIDPATLRGEPVGVYVGAGGSDYGPRLADAPDQLSGRLLTGTAGGLASGRVAYTFGFTGPALTVDTACSSGLVALHLAGQALRRGDCRLAVVAAATVMATPGYFLEFSRQRGLAGDARCKPFSERADGTIWSEGAGTLLLERLSDARLAGHRVLAVLRGSAVNSDGASNGLTAPSGLAQENVVRAALADAGVRPGDVDLVEAHGTGTRLGDPIEAQALVAAYGTGRRPDRPLWLGSVKGTIGHTQAAAGLAGVIKTIAALDARVLPVSRYASDPTPHVDWTSGAVRLLDRSRPWPGPDGSRMAGVSAFGISGTNAHVILQEAAVVPAAARRSDAVPDRPFVLSARTPERLRAQAARLREHLDGDPGDLAFSLATTRRHFEVRAAVPATGREDLAEALDALAAGRPGRAVTGRARAHRLAFLYGGQGAHGTDAILRLAEREPAVRETLDEIGVPAGDILAATATTLGTGAAQPAIFAAEVAMARLLQRWGVRPDVQIGHSVGEVAAAHVAGVLSLADALTLVTARGRLMQALPAGGAMVAIEATEREIGPLLNDQVAVAAVNGRRAVVLSGDEAAVLRVAATFAGRGRRTRRLAVRHAFHSRLMEPMLADFRTVLAGLGYRRPVLPIISTLTGEPVTDEMSGPDYWLRQVREPVRFAAAVGRAGCDIHLELSPSPVLTAAVRDCLDDPAMLALPLLAPGGASPAPALSQLYAAGVDIDWAGLFAGHPGRAVRLPTYAFDTTRYWLDPGLGNATAPAGLDRVDHPVLGAAVELPDGDDLLLTGQIGRSGQPWLADHVVLGTVLVPGAAVVELAASAALEAGCDEVGDLVQHRPLALTDETPRRIRVVVGRAGDRRSLRVQVREGNTWQTYAEGTATVAAPAPVVSHRPPPEAVEEPAAALYERLAGTGLNYGPAFACVHRLWRHGATVFAELRPAAGPDRYLVHPTLLDAALHAGVGAQPAQPGRPRVPVAWRGVRLRANAATTLWARIRPAGDGVEIHLGDENDMPVASVDAVTLLPVTAAQLAGTTAALHRLTWRPAGSTVTPRPRRWAYLGADEHALAAALPRTGRAVDIFPDLASLEDALASGAPVPESVLVAAVTGANRDPARSIGRAIHRVLGLTQAWLADERLDRTRLVLVTTGAATTGPGDEAPELTAAAIAGLVRSAQTENPDRFTLLDLDRSAASARAIASAAELSVPYLAVRDGVAMTASLGRAAGGLPRPWPASGTVLITGGTGGFGALLARHLAGRHGVRDLVLVSRRGPDAPGAAALVAELAVLGASATVLAADVGVRGDVSAVLDRVRSRHPRVAVVHAAGVLDDGALTALTPRRFDRVLRAKAYGALHLDELTRTDDLTAFVLFSSIMGVAGGPGQANYAAANAMLDALAVRRRSEGRPATALAWGPWGDGAGVTRDLSAPDRARLARSGLVPLTDEQAMALFDQALGAGDPVLVPASLNAGGAGTGDGVPALLRRSGPAAGPAVGPAVLTVPAERRLPDLERLVRTAAADVLGHHPDEVAGDQPLLELGLDSLNAIELHQRLVRLAGVRLPWAKVLAGQTADSLAGHLYAAMPAGER